MSTSSTVDGADRDQRDDSEMADSDMDDGASRTPADAQHEATTPKEPRRIGFKLSSVITGLVIVVVAIIACVFAILYYSANGELTERDARAADDERALQVATDYAVGASTIDFNDTKAWFDKLKTNTTPQLAAKFDATAAQLDQILLPLQWTSTASPITAVVTSESDGVYKVNAFLNVTSTSAQTPQGVQTTVTYALTIDKNSDWKINDVGGLEGALPVK